MPRAKRPRASRGERFARGLAALRSLVRRHGHARVPAGHLEGGINLMRWVSAQRELHRRGAQLTVRRRRLEAVPGWSWSLREGAFERALAEFRRYVLRHGHARVPDVKRRKGPYVFLALWVKRQRALKKTGGLPRDRVRQLERLPRWSWEPGGEGFEKGLSALQRFVRREGHALVARSHTERGFRLGIWVNSQRRRFVRGLMPADHKRRLEAVKGWRWRVVRRAARRAGRRA